jgi:hypothetical protein
MAVVKGLLVFLVVFLVLGGVLLLVARTQIHRGASHQRDWQIVCLSSARTAEATERCANADD